MNNKLVKLSRILFDIMVILTLLLILVCGLGNEEIIQKSISVYGIIFLLSLLYIPIATFIQLKNLNKRDSKDRIIRFIKTFICYFLILGLLSIIFKSKNFDILTIITISFGTSFGISFLDLLIFKKNNI